MKYIYRILSVIVGILFLAYFLKLYSQLPKINFYDFLKEVNYFYVFISLTAYLLSHALRAIRIAVLIGRQDYSIWKLMYLQYYTNGINLIIPFKLGEVYRIVEFNKLIRDHNKLVLTVIAEKTLDLLLLFFWAAVAIWVLGKHIPQLEYVLWVISALIMISLIIFFVLPENIRTFNLMIAKRYNKRWVIQVLSMTNRLSNIISNIKEILRTNVSTISMLTLLIWFLELLGFTYLMPFMAEKSQVWLLSILVFLSGLIPSASLGFGGLQLGFSTMNFGETPYNGLIISLTYQAFIFSPAVVLGLFLYLYITMRQKKSKIFTK